MFLLKTLHYLRGDGISPALSIHFFFQVIESHDFLSSNMQRVFVRREKESEALPGNESVVFHQRLDNTK